MDIFVDTGVIIGYADQDDITFHKPCSDFTDKYRFREHAYYSNKGVIEVEISKKERERRKIRTKTIFRRFMQRSRLFCDKLIDASYEGHCSFKDLFSDIHNTLQKNGKPHHRMDRDAKLLTSSYLWEYMENGLKNPHFITTDWHDIYTNRDKIENDANTRLLYKSRLTIEFVTHMA